MTMALETTQPKRGLFTMAAAVSLATLPLMQSMTIQAGFPVKIYEVVLLTSLAMLPFYGRLVFPRSAIPVTKVTACWMLLVTVLLVVKITWPPVSMSETGIAGRFGAAGDGVAKLVYLWLNLFGFLLFASQARRNEDFFVKAWLCGALLAASYEFYLVAANLAGIIEPPMLPNSKGVLFSVAGHVFQRAATFTEGNYSGLYFILSTFIALHARYRRVAVITAAAAVTSFSTPTFIVLSGLGAYYAWRFFAGLRPITKFFVAPIFIACALVVGGGLATTALFQTTVTSKLTSEEGTTEAYSRVERLRTARGAWEMFKDNPFTGVGIAQFGYNLQHYEPTSIAGKQIPNVVYLEFLSEDGLIVFAIFLYSIWIIYRRTLAPGERYLQIGVISLMLYFVAFPTISIMYVWAFLALIAGRQRGPFAATPWVSA